MRHAVPLGALLALSLACSDDEGPDTPADAGASDSGQAPDAGCCNDAACEADGLVCNRSSCVCETLMGGACQAAGQPCDPDVGQASAFLCVPDGAGSGVCRSGCGATASCPAGQTCTDGAPRFCAPSCGGFFTDDCGEGGKCIPTSSGSGVCIPTGGGIEGGSCVGSVECGPNLLCVGGQCTEPDCTPLSNTRPCINATEDCSPFLVGNDPIDLGVCVASCDPFATPDPCPSGQWCRPSSRNGAGELRGRCADNTGGVATEGETCELMPNLDCAEPFLCVAGICRSFCDPMSATTMVGECDGTQICVELTTGNDTLPFGACFASPCTPWSSDPITAGCTIDQWCLPDPADPVGGECADGTGTLVAGSACPSAGDECGPGLICAAGECTVVCDPDAALGSFGDTCDFTEGCFQLSLDDGNGGTTPAAIGLCTASCGYDEAFDCTEPTDTCVPGELLDTDFDVCTNEVPSPPLQLGDDCALAGLLEFSFCAETGVCLSTQNGLTCVYICRASVAPLDSTNHPDCPDPGQTCASVFMGNAALGACTP